MITKKLVQQIREQQKNDLWKLFKEFLQTRTNIKILEWRTSEAILKVNNTEVGLELKNGIIKVFGKTYKEFNLCDNYETMLYRIIVCTVGGGTNE